MATQPLEDVSATGLLAKIWLIAQKREPGIDPTQATFLIRKGHLLEIELYASQAHKLLTGNRLSSLTAAKEKEVDECEDLAAEELLELVGMLTARYKKEKS